MKNNNDVCEICGEPTRVRILEGYIDGKPMLRHFCFRCADEAHVKMQVMAGEHSGRRMSIGGLLIFAGLFVGAIGVLGDYLGIEGHSGLGWYQQTGIALGALLIVVGSLFRVDTMAEAGVLVFGLSLLADVFGLRGAAGIGWKQQLATLAGVAMALTGIWLRRRARGYSVIETSSG